MSHRKPKGRRPSPRHRRSHGLRQQNRRPHPPSPLGDYLLTRLVDLGGQATLAELQQDPALDRRQRRECPKVLQDLLHRGLLTTPRKKTYRLARPGDYLDGTISANPRGFAFATDLSSTTGPVPGSDLFLAPRDLNNSRQGDRVLLELTHGRGELPTARVLAIRQRGIATVIGIYRAGTPSGLVEPEDSRLNLRLTIARDKALDARDGMLVIARIIGADSHGTSRYVAGEIVEILGDPLTLKVQSELTIRAHGLATAFTNDALAEARQLDRTIRLTADRIDLRHIPLVTIDGETARDFDDAVAVQRGDFGFRLYVAIADVSHYVQPGSALDREAYDRGTSVYFPDRVLPMLPETLSNDLCSLLPDTDRYAFTAILDFDTSGRRTASRFSKSVIRSRHRLTYDQVRDLLDSPTPTLERNTVLPMLTTLAELARLLADKRRRRGSIGFEIPEAVIALSDDGTITALQRRHRHFAHKIIEECMLAANEAVAEYFHDHGNPKLPFLYRIHEAPDPEKLEVFKAFIGSMGLTPAGDQAGPSWFASLLDQVNGTAREYIISNLMLRVMQQARYAPDNVGHFGLAASFYTHFTSPIRRYPDLLVHRALGQLLTKSKPVPTSPTIQEMGEFLSQRERIAVDAEREIADRAKCLFMADKIGRDFQAVVSGVTSFGIFVELLDHHAGGAVALNDLDDDAYQVDEKLHRLVGRRTGKTLQIGNTVTVRLVRVDLPRRRLDFQLRTTDTTEADGEQ